MNISNIEYAASLFSKRDKLLKEYNELKPIIQKLNQQPMDKKTYLSTHKVGSASGLRTASNVLFVISIIVLIYGFLRAGTMVNHYFDSDVNSFWHGALALFLILLVAAGVMGTISSSMKKSAYNNYIAENAFFIQQNSGKAKDYENVVKELQNLDKTLSDTKISIVPNIYWNSADVILGAMKNGLYDSVGDCVRAMEISPAIQNKSCPKCNRTNYSSLIFCENCGGLL